LNCQARALPLSYTPGLELIFLNHQPDVKVKELGHFLSLKHRHNAWHRMWLWIDKNDILRNLSNWWDYAGFKSIKK
jgi:hypothetical protein